jgi:hypothetical protein
MTTTTTTTTTKCFRDLKYGETFDFLDPDRHLNSFFERCHKIGPRTFRIFGNKHEYRVGSVHARVYNVGLVSA